MKEGGEQKKRTENVRKATRERQRIKGRKSQGNICLRDCMHS